MTTYQVSLPALENAMDAAKALAQLISTTLSTLEQDLATHLSEWTGTARDSYTQCKAAWDAAAALIPAALAAAGVALQAIAETYDSAERSAINAFSWS